MIPTPHRPSKSLGAARATGRGGTSVARFQPGDRIRVRVEHLPTHVRTPAFIMGKTGVVDRVHGSFANPERLAYGADGLPPVPLYFVRFDAPRVWPGAPTTDTILIDLYEHWLEPADAGERPERATPADA